MGSHCTWSPTPSSTDPTRKYSAWPRFTATDATPVGVTVAPPLLSVLLHSSLPPRWIATRTPSPPPAASSGGSKVTSPVIATVPP